MRRFSQRNSLVTLNEINITPLLDLAFVLLIIFVITTPILDQTLDLKLPEGGSPPRKMNREDLVTAEVSERGEYYLNGKAVGRFEQFQTQLTALKQRKPNMVVNIRADRGAAYDHPFKIMNLCQRLGVPIGLASDPTPKR